MFTDGACEAYPTAEQGIQAGYGAVIYDPKDGTTVHFGDVCDTHLLRKLTSEGEKTQIVGQSELLPCLAVKEIWSEKLRKRLVLWFIDNDAARFCLIKGGSPTKESAWLATRFWETELEVGCHSWFERVPSPSNPADDPSRGRPSPELNGKASTEAPLPDKFEQDLCILWTEQMRGMFKTGGKATLTKKALRRAVKLKPRNFASPPAQSPSRKRSSWVALGAGHGFVAG